MQRLDEPAKEDPEEVIQKLRKEVDEMKVRLAKVEAAIKQPSEKNVAPSKTPAKDSKANAMVEGQAAGNGTDAKAKAKGKKSKGRKGTGA